MASNYLAAGFGVCNVTYLTQGSGDYRSAAVFAVGLSLPSPAGTLPSYAGVMPTYTCLDLAEHLSSGMWVCNTTCANQGTIDYPSLKLSSISLALPSPTGTAPASTYAEPLYTSDDAANYLFSGRGVCNIASPSLGCCDYASSCVFAVGLSLPAPSGSPPTYMGIMPIYTGLSTADCMALGQVLPLEQSPVTASTGITVVTTSAS
jgi:hypothetical protein